MKEGDFNSFMYDLYRAWCNDHDLDYKDDANKEAFLKEALPS